MRKIVLTAATLLIAWVGVSVGVGLFLGYVFNPLAGIAVAISSPATVRDNYNVLLDLLILVLTLLVFRATSGTFMARWGGKGIEHPGTTARAREKPLKEVLTKWMGRNAFGEIGNEWFLIAGIAIAVVAYLTDAADNTAAGLIAAGAWVVLVTVYARRQMRYQALAGQVRLAGDDREDEPPG